MINAVKIEEQYKMITETLKKMSPAENEILSDKLIAWLLFRTEKDIIPEKTKTPKKTSSRKKKNPISKKDQELLKKIANKTDELYKKFGDDTI